jgi:hypothetical protein
LGLLAALVISGGSKTPPAVEAAQNSFADEVEDVNQGVS